MKGIDYISSIGIKVILLAEKKLKRKNATFAMVNLQPQIKKVLDAVRILSIVNIFDNMEEADMYIDQIIKEEIEKEKTKQAYPIYYNKMMGRIVIIAILSLGLLSVDFLAPSIVSDCKGECSCCDCTDNCQMDACFSNWQPLLFARPINLLPEIVLKDFLKPKLIFNYTKKPVRRIFRPPKYV
jgi:hypothetical protein